MTAAAIEVLKKTYKNKTTDKPVLMQRGQQRKEVILIVAAELFLKHGYQGTSLDTIIAQAGGSKGAIYRIFNGKKGLFSAVVERLCYDFLSDLRTIDIRNATLGEGLRRILHELVRVLTMPRHADFYRLIVADSEQFPQAGHTWFVHGPAIWLDVIGRLFETQRQRGLIHANAPDAVIAQILFNAVLSHLTTQCNILGQPADNTFAAPLIEELICMTEARLNAA